MRPRIIEECRRKMYDAVWMEIDRDPQRPAVARVDVETPAGNICVWCDRTGNVAVISHKTNNNESERLAEAIERSLDFQQVMDDYLTVRPEAASQDEGFADRYETARLDELMGAFVDCEL